jgi:hypothetical protein
MLAIAGGNSPMAHGMVEDESRSGAAADRSRKQP